MNTNRITTSLVCFFAALTLTVSASAQAPVQKTDANRVRAAALWEEAIRAKGGRERLQSIENFLITSTIDVEAPRGGGLTETERLYAMPGRAWLYEFTPHFDVSLEATVINTKSNLCMVTLSPARGDVPSLSYCLPTTWAARLIQDPVIYLMETKWIRPVPVRTRVEGTGNKQVDVIETEVGKLRVDFYLHRKTRLPFKLVTDEYYGENQMTGRMELTVNLDDYQNVDGIQMPRRVTRQPDVGPQIVRRDTERARYKFNVAYNSTIFDQPVSKKAKSGDWKP
jgi:hypothetical protein